MGQVYDGQALELTWTNKAKRLLAPDDGSYEWVSTSDHRVAEVRLLRDAAAVGKVHSESRREQDNLLIRGDALNAMTSLSKLPEFAREYAGKVKLCYIDPPFNTGQAFEHYDDGLEHSVWLTMMRDRLLQIRDLLAPEGSVWVHLDDREVHRARLVLDEVFGPEAFISTVVWENFYGRSNTAAISPSHNYLHVYSPIGKERWRYVRRLLPREGKSRSKYSNPDNDSRGPWRNGPIFASEERHDGLMYEVTTPGGRKVSPPKGSHWRMLEPDFWQMVEEGRITFGADGQGVPAVKLFLEDVQDGLVPRSWWAHTEVGHSQEGKREIQALFPEQLPFATPKPERLLERIIRTSTSPGEVVLDCFVGSGTTAAVAHKMGRRWIAVEREAATVEQFCLPRLVKVVEGTDLGGVTDAVGWESGGGFRVLDVAPSMFVSDLGVTLLAEWATTSALAEATAAQLGYEYEPEPPFAGRKGRVRLAVIDGLVTARVAEMLVAALSPDERVAVYGTSIETDARDALKAARPGSTLSKIPRALLARYQHARPTFLRKQNIEPADEPLTSDADRGEVRV